VARQNQREKKRQFKCLYLYSIGMRYIPFNLIFKTENPEKTALDNLIDHDFDIDHACGGMGSCGTCRIFVEKGNDRLGPRNPTEFEMAQNREFKPNERLSCQISANVDFEFFLPKDFPESD